MADTVEKIKRSFGGRGHCKSETLKAYWKAKMEDTLVAAQATHEIKSTNAEQHMREGLDAAYAAAEERKRQENFTKRRTAEEYVKYGVDECGATGGGHGSMQLQSDGRRYCEYCGAEALPEHVAEWESKNEEP